MSEIRKNLKEIEKNLKIIKVEIIIFACLVSFLAGVLVGKWRFT